MSTIAQLDEAIAVQGARVRDLKLNKAAANVVEPEINELKRLKAELTALKPPEVKASDAGKVKAQKGKGKEVASTVQLKVPKGTKDHLPNEMFLRKQLFSTITRVFELHGGVTIDTPVFELREILTGKYGEDSKLIYDLQDQGGELCSLRYDLTVPFARFLAMNGRQYQNIKRYHIAKVYRRDNPAMTKGRLREFYQCDFDIAGTYDPMIPDAEILLIICQILQALDIGEFTIKLNHRKLLDGIFELCGVPADKIRTISSAVDKLDKLPWADVRKEMVEDKQLNSGVADMIGDFVKLKGGVDLLGQLKEHPGLAKNARAQEALADMTLLFDYVGVFGISDKISFDLSLARGLDYYTGLIYEAVTALSAPPSMQNGTAQATTATKKLASANDGEEIDESQIGVGSIAAGGRYDNLVGMFSGAAGGAGQIPCVGISFGVERIFAILQQQRAAAAEAAKMKEVDVLVMNMNNKDGQIKERMEIAKLLWDAGITAEYLYKVKPRQDSQWSVLERDSIPIAVFIGGREWAEGKVRVKEQLGKDAGKAQGEGDEVSKFALVEDIKRRIAVLPALDHGCSGPPDAPSTLRSLSQGVTRRLALPATLASKRKADSPRPDVERPAKRSTPLKAEEGSAPTTGKANGKKGRKSKYIKPIAALVKVQDDAIEVDQPPFNRTAKPFTDDDDLLASSLPRSFRRDPLLVHRANSADMDELSSGSDSDYANSWIAWFLSTKGNEYFCEVDEEYILDRFNLTGLNSEVHHYSQALDVITDSAEEDVNEEMRDSIESAARHLYGLIHARFIITSRGLTKMIDKYKKADFGRCPRVLCYGQALLPVGLSDIAYQKAVKLYCPRCEDIYSPKSSRHGAIDGAYFGTTFPHMLFMVHPHLVPAKTTSQSGALGVQMTPAAASVAAPTSTATSGATGTTTTGQAAPNSGAQTGAANAALKAERYRPRVFGFQLHEVARLQRWQEAHRNSQLANDKDAVLTPERPTEQRHSRTDSMAYTTASTHTPKMPVADYVFRVSSSNGQHQRRWGFQGQLTEQVWEGLVERCSGLLSVPKDQIQLHALDENNAPVLSLAGYGNFVMACAQYLINEPKLDSKGRKVIRIRCQPRPDQPKVNVKPADHLSEPTPATAQTPVIQPTLRRPISLGAPPSLASFQQRAQEPHTTRSASVSDLQLQAMVQRLQTQGLAVDEAVRRATRALQAVRPPCGRLDPLAAPRHAEQVDPARVVPRRAPAPPMLAPQSIVPSPLLPPCPSQVRLPPRRLSSNNESSVAIVKQMLVTFMRELNSTLSANMGEAAVDLPAIVQSVVPKKEEVKVEEESTTPKMPGAFEVTSWLPVQSEPAAAVHPGVYCDGCQRTLRGVRMKCQDCRNFDLCSDCFDKPAFHASTHRFQVIPAPNVHGEILTLAELVAAKVKATTDSATASMTSNPTVPIRKTTLVKHDAVCDFCAKTIIGTRWRCADNCPDFDACDDCIVKAPRLHPDHTFLSVDKPTKIYVPTELLTLHPRITCDGCSKPCRGARYKCTNSRCPDFDLCAACEALPIPVHDPSHLLLKIKSPKYADVESVNQGIALGRSLEPAGLGARTTYMAAEKEGEPNQLIIDVNVPGLGDRELRIPINLPLEQGLKVALAPVEIPAEVDKQAETEKVEVEKETAEDMQGTTPVQQLQSLLGGFIAATAASMVEQAPAEAAVEEKVAYEASFDSDVTVADGTVVATGALFAKVWRLVNTGKLTWPEGSALQHVGGFGADAKVEQIPLAEPGQTVEVTVYDMRAPVVPGRYLSFWRLVSRDGERFGDRIWVEINVNDDAMSMAASSTSLASSSVVIPTAPSLAAPSVASSTGTSTHAAPSLASAPGSSVGGSWEDDAEFVALSDSEGDDLPTLRDVDAMSDFSSDDDETWPEGTTRA